MKIIIEFALNLNFQRCIENLRISKIKDNKYTINKLLTFL